MSGLSLCIHINFYPCVENRSGVYNNITKLGRVLSYSTIYFNVLSVVKVPIYNLL